MQKKSVGKQIWEIFSPILIHLGVTLVVEMVITMVYYMRSIPELVAAMESEEAFTQYIWDMYYNIEQYMVEISAIAALVTIPLLIWMARKDAKKEKTAGVLQNKKAPWSKYILIIGISISLSVGLNNILTLSNIAAYSDAYQETAEALYTPSFPVQILCLGIVIPIMEEYIFRGLIYKRMRRNMSVINAMIFSAVLFGGFHVNLVQTIYGLLCGLLLAYLYEKYGSMKAPILAHMLMNIVSCVLTEMDAFTWMFTKPIRMAVITIACAAIASTMFIFIRDIDEKPEEDVVTTQP